LVGQAADRAVRFAQLVDDPSAHPTRSPPRKRKPRSGAGCQQRSVRSENDAIEVEFGPFVVYGDSADRRSGSIRVTASAGA